MAKQKTSIPKGTRDFLPNEAAKRDFLFSTLKSVFIKYGFQPIETPAVENLSTLTGKYGEEGDRLIFKILNSGDFMSKVSSSDFSSLPAGKSGAMICEKALRYDLTVPFARFVVQHQNDITFPFKRYQIQPVWRADRPQKGRYREFFQCDIDVIGSNSILNEFELIRIIDEAFHLLKINVTIKVNNRKILSGIAEYINETEKITDITVAIDKLEKIGLEKVKEELLAKGISLEAIKKLEPIMLLSGDFDNMIKELSLVLKDSEIGQKGIEELLKINNYISKFSLNNGLELDVTLARGLNYYTGAIIEVKANDVSIGSICGGGRYDNLTGIFGLDNVSGVGVSFGADRIYDVLKELDLFPKLQNTCTRVLFLNMGEDEELFALKTVNSLRNNGIPSEIYPDKVKMKKQMNYANKNKIPFVVIIGELEMQSEKIALKNMETGEQQVVSSEEAIEIINKYA